MLSIIIPAYNASKTIDRCIDSIQQNKDKNFEIIVVDDGSTDNQNDIINALRKRYHNITLLTQNNEGCLSARMHGFLMATGAYCTTVDADDYVTKDYVGQINNLIKRNEDIDYFLFNNYRNDMGPEVFNKERAISEMEISDKVLLLKKIVFEHECAIWNKVFRTTLMKETAKELEPYYSVIYGEDQIINVAYMQNGLMKRALIKDIAVYYHYKEMGVTGQKKIEKCFDDAIKLLQYYDEIVFRNKKYDNRLSSQIIDIMVRSIAGLTRRMTNEEIKDDKSKLLKVLKIMKKYKIYRFNQLLSRVYLRLEILIKYNGFKQQKGEGFI